VRRADRGEFEWLAEEYRESHLDGVLLAVAATDDPALNKQVVEKGKVRGILVCDASSRERTEVIFGALTRAEGVTVAVFTDGRDPAQARRTRDRIAAFLVGDGGEE
jgi:uroporphyrin-III C-methyltransferase/precorrin-2 dehydrogenase/sirohydrochlorin ferrochelatase